MSPPAEPYIPSVTAGLSAQEAADADKDFLFFLRNVRLDGDAYAVVLPSEDGASSPPLVIRYEQPLPDHNAGIPVAGSNRGRKRAPPSSEENPWATSKAPKGVKRKAPDASSGGEVRSGAVPMEEDSSTPVVEPAWYDSQPDIDEDYRFFLRHVCNVDDKLVVEPAWYDSQPDIDEDYRFFLRHVCNVDGKLVFKTGNCSITLGEGSVDHSDAEDDDGTEEEGEEGEEEKDDEVDSPSSGQSGEDGIGAEEKDYEEEAIPASVTEDGVGSDLPILKVKEEDVKKDDDDDDVGSGADVQIVNEPVYYETEVEGAEKQLNALVRGTTDLDPLGKKEASSSKAHLGMPLNASELQGVIWPPHINERPNSVFKAKLIEFLNKPFTKKEYDEYFAQATDRKPLIKERRTRNKVAYYPWKHELNKSYFDNYPDLAEQFSLQCNNYPNRLALLRGLFFWLQNVELEGKFMPWSDGFKKYRVVTFME